MKKFKLLPSILMLVACVAVLGVGVFAVAPTQNTISGSITINSANPEVIISAYHHNEDGTLNTTNPIINNVTVRSGVDIDVGTIQFDVSNCNTEDDLFYFSKSITIRLQNPVTKKLGVYFSEQEVVNTSTEDYVITTKTLTTNDSKTDVVNATLSGYLCLIAKNGEVNGCVDMVVTFNLLKFVEGSSNVSVDIGSGDNLLFLNIEECNEAIAPTLIGTTGILTSRDMPAEYSNRIQVAYGVTSLADNSLCYLEDGPIEVILPDGLISIGQGAFATSYIHKINLPNGLTTIREGCF